MNYSILQSNIGTNAERIAFIDFKLRFTGLIKRSDLYDEYGLSDTSATRLISLYSELRPKNLSYNRVKKVNVIEADSYTPLIELDMDISLGMLAHGFNKNKLTDNPIVPYTKIGAITNLVNLDDVAKITRALSNKQAIACTYISGNSEKRDSRVLIPLAILSDGKNWIFRAYDRSESKNEKFKNFNFSRVANITDVPIEELEQKNYEAISQDSKWNLTLPVSLELHPTLSDYMREVIRTDYGMQPDQNELVIMEKAAFLWILTKQWNIDTNKSNNNKSFYKFTLKNLAMLEQYV